MLAGYAFFNAAWLSRGSLEAFVSKKDSRSAGCVQGGGAAFRILNKARVVGASKKDEASGGGGTQ